MIATNGPKAVFTGAGDPAKFAVGEEIRRRMKVGILVDAEVVLQLLVDEMKKRRARGFETFLIEGFPRTRHQAKMFEKFVRRDGTRCCVSVEATPTAKLKRLRERWLLALSAADERVLPAREDEEEPTALDRIETFERTKGEGGAFVSLCLCFCLCLSVFLSVCLAVWLTV